MSQPPLCAYRDLCDGTYSLGDLLVMHDVLDEIAEARREAMKARR